jgi:hypothetical protein
MGDPIYKTFRVHTPNQYSYSCLIHEKYEDDRVLSMEYKLKKFCNLKSWLHRTRDLNWRYLCTHYCMFELGLKKFFLFPVTSDSAIVADNRKIVAGLVPMSTIDS